MICSSCRRTILSRLPRRTGGNPPQLRPNTTTAAPSQSPSATSDTPGKSQPFSTPLLPSTASASQPTTTTNKKSPAATAASSKSSSKKKPFAGSIPGGEMLRGLGYMKAQPAVLAREDDEYPDWLWTLLGPTTTPGSSSTSAGADGGKSAADVAALPKAARERYLKKQEKQLRAQPKPVPLHEQSRDLTGPGDGPDLSLRRRQDLVASSRVARRKNIQEENFLRGL